MVEPAIEKPEGEDVDANFIEVPAILDKHKAAGQVTNAALLKAQELCIVGGDTHSICTTVDKFMEEELKKVYTNKKAKKLERGIAFPCTLSVNQICGHYSPLPDETTLLNDGDLVKIDLGCHIDGYATQAAQTIVIAASGDKVTGRKADVIIAAHTAM